MLKRMRKICGDTQTEVAHLIDISHSGNISRWEQGDILLSSIYLIELLIIYQTSTDKIYPEMWQTLQKDIQEKLHVIKRNKSLRLMT